jgi:hypothetical protein
MIDRARRMFRDRLDENGKHLAKKIVGIFVGIIFLREKLSILFQYVAPPIRFLSWHHLIVGS